MSDLFRRFSPQPVPAASPAAAPADDSRALLRAAAATAGHAPREAELLAALERLPPLPTVVRRILDLVGSDRGSAADLGELVRLDLVITAKLLKLVNSPFYGLSFHVTSVAQAVTMIGFGGVRSLAVAASLSDLLVQQLEVYGFSERGLWKNSIATATMARAIAVAAGLGPDEGEEAFVGGLMRDIGMLVLGPFLAQAGHILRRRDGDGDIIQRERELIGYDHCWISERIGEKWRLPQGIRLVLGRHHRPPPGLAAEQVRLLAAVRLAERLAYASRIGVIPDHPFEVRIDSQLIQGAGLDAGHFQSLMQQLPGVIAGADLNV